MPLLSNARLCFPPAATAVTPLSPLTATGTELFAVVPLPSWPLRFSPHAMTVPLLSRAMLWLPPAETAVTPLRALTAAGAALFVIVPLPSCPSALAPHATAPGEAAPAGAAAVAIAREALGADRFLSDLGRWQDIRDPFLRGLTRAALEAPIPVLLGGHSLMSGGLMALNEHAWKQRDIAG